MRSRLQPDERNALLHRGVVQVELRPWLPSLRTGQHRLRDEHVEQRHPVRRLHERLQQGGQERQSDRLRRQQVHVRRPVRRGVRRLRREQGERLRVRVRPREAGVLLEPAVRQRARLRRIEQVRQVRSQGRAVLSELEVPGRRQALHQRKVPEVPRQGRGVLELGRLLLREVQERQEEVRLTPEPREAYRLLGAILCDDGWRT